jgi:hypothetical protein
MGGLGNQLFQIFATIAYALQYNHSFIFTYSDFLTIGKLRPTYWHSFLSGLLKYTNKNTNLLTNNVLDSLSKVNES